MIRLICLLAAQASLDLCTLYQNTSLLGMAGMHPATKIHPACFAQLFRFDYAMGLLIIKGLASDFCLLYTLCLQKFPTGLVVHWGPLAAYLTDVVDLILIFFSKVGGLGAGVIIHHILLPGCQY